MAFFKRYLMVLYVVCGVCGVAQPLPPENPGNAARRVTVVGLQSPGADYSNLVLLQGTRPLDLQVKVNSRTNPVVLSGGVAALSLAKRAAGVAGANPGYVPLSELSWPDGQSREALLVVGPASGGKGAIRGLLLDDSLKGFPAHSIRVLNLTGIPILAKVNDFRGELRSGALAGPIHYPDLSKLPPNSLARYPVAFALRKPDGELVTLSSGYFEAAPGSRSLIIVQAPAEAGSNKIRIRTVVDRPAPQPAAQNAR